MPFIPLRVLTAPPIPVPTPSSPAVNEGFDLGLNTANVTWRDWLVGTPLRVVIILIVGFVILLLVRRAIRIVTEHIAEGPRTVRGAALMRVTPTVTARRSGRARTLGSVLRSTANIIIGSIMTLMVLEQVDINVAPLLASAGVAGVALGFGAQSLVKDFLSGTFLLLEDQFGVGDVVDFGTVTGTVEEVALRVTKVRSADGTLWYMRNGEILRTGNKTQGWGRATIDVPVAYDVDVEAVRELLKKAASQVVQDTDLSPVLLGSPEVLGVEELTDAQLLFRITVKTLQGRQDEVARALRIHARAVLQEAGIPMATVV